MHGKMIVFRPGVADPTVTSYDTALPFAALPNAVGGYIELVPYFTSYHDPERGCPVFCYAFCNEDGKRLELPVNHAGQALWQDALDRFFAEARGAQPVKNHDILVGPLAIVTGDDEFLAEL